MSTNQRFRRCAAPSAAAALVISLASPAFSQSDLPFLSPLFTDNMVLQRGIKDPVWGWTTPGQSVTVQVAGQKATATAGPGGKWTAYVGPFKAGGPYTISVSGPQSVTLSNVMVGDVWICSGQSNMEFGVKKTIDAAREIAAADNPMIRIFTTPKALFPTPQVNLAVQNPGPQWQPATPDTVSSQGTWDGFTAVGYFFGRDLEADIKVPIGLIEASWGGTPAEAWTSREALHANLPTYDPQLDLLDPSSNESADEMKAAWYQKNDPGVAGAWQSVALDTTDWKPIKLPGYFQQAGIPELENTNGIVWFRGTFDLPAGDAGKDGVLHELVDDYDTTWVNGVKVGATERFDAQRAYAIPAALLKPAGNVIAIRCLDTGGVGGVWGDPAALKVTFDGGSDVPLAGTWQCRLGTPSSRLSAYPGAAGNSSYPTVIYNGMINPLEPFGIKGVIWYQGENNDGKAFEYRTLLPTMIGDWRAHWNEGNFPFLIVQLAGNTVRPTWPEVRQAQWLTAQTVPNAGIVTAIDIGDPNDIHPTNKQEVGRRLALVAESQVYGQKVASSGPVYKSAAPEGSAMRISFRDIDGGLVAKGGAPLLGFEIAGPDGKFVAADAKIDGATVVVSSPQVAVPIAVQYDWADCPPGNLYNGAGLPTFPFKTDEK